MIDPSLEVLVNAIVRELPQCGLDRTHQTDDDPARRVEKAYIELQEIFGRYVSSQGVVRRFRWPDDVLAWLLLGGGTWGTSDPYGIEFYGTSDMIEMTRYACELFGEDGSTTGGLWVNMGRWGDRHDLLVCVDGDHKALGRVFDFNDDHPWCSNISYSDQETDWLGFIRRWASKQRNSGQIEPGQ